MLKEEGVRGFYRGLEPTILGLIPNWAVYFVVYENAKKVIATVNHDKESKQGYKISTVLASSVVAGAVTQTITSPFWVVRTRFQTQMGENKYKNTFDAMRRIAKKEGVRALYRGLLPSFFGLTHVAVQFPLYETLKRDFMHSNERKVQAAGLTEDDPNYNAAVQLSIPQVLASSIISKICASVVAYPHEVLRTRLQDYGHSKQLGSVAYTGGFFGMVKTIYREEGIRSFYKGLTPTLLRVTPAAAVTFCTYEIMLRFLKNHFS
eukprot:GEZU01015745.1.p1 GENE.GEZU01015745.1~~GEZU01015745.1.p1  ORF type:complete len:263 (+),score=45.27 GEZU01015745.1:177-965(+)